MGDNRDDGDGDHGHGGWRGVPTHRGGFHHDRCPDRCGHPHREPDHPESLADSFWSVVRLLRHASMESLQQWGVTPSQVRTLRVLARHGAIRQSELAAHLRIAARSVTEFVDDLEEKGLAARQPDPGDRRARLVVLTEHGATIGKEIRDARGAEAERIFDRLEHADRDELARILRVLQEPREDQEPRS